MTKFFIYWEVDPVSLPRDPVERMQLFIQMTQMVKDDADAGLVSDWGIRVGMSSGYGISADMTEAEVHAWVNKWSGYVNFTVNPVLSVEEHLDTLKKLAEAMANR
jgi:hypothetical protein